MMSITALQDRLNRSVRKFADDDQIFDKFAKPHRLTKTLHLIEHRFDELENAQPVEEKLLKSLAKLEQKGAANLSKRDWKNLSWALSQKLLNYEEKILFTFVGAQLVEQFKQMHFERIKTVYFPLLYSYFAVEKSEIDKCPNNWVALRAILNTHRSTLFQSTPRPKQWLTTLSDYPEVLSNEPSKRFIQDFLHSGNNSVSTQLASLNIAPNSWFWQSLIEACIKSIRNMAEDDFIAMIPHFLRLQQQNQLYTTEILKALLERYAATSQRGLVHEGLKQVSLTHWGNPQYDAAAGWKNVSESTKNMVIQWFVRADLEAFFRLFSHTADVHRFDYWIKFIDKISFSQIFLGSAAWSSKNHEHKAFREKNRGRLKELVGSSPSNNAFLLKIDNIYIVDFSDTGNACYGYSQLPFNTERRSTSISDLKNKQRSVFKNDYNEGMGLSHAGNWEKRFDERLAEIGIFANKESKQTSRYAYQKRRY